MLPKPCYCINPHCQQPDHPDNINNNFCNNCGSNLLINGKYRVKRLLSDHSGFGIIYEVESHQRKILKVLKSDHNNSSKAIDLFKQEYQVLLNLTQQGITGIPQVEKDDYFQYQTKNNLILHCIVMEKVEGIDLEQWVKNNGKLSQKQAIKWLREITQILGKIHEKNYFHRDLKPANIMQRNNGELVLIDFGTAREETQTYYQKLNAQYVTGIESAGYTPEEQKNGQAVMQSDFFALGRTFIHLLTGKFPLDMYDPYHNTFRWREETENINTLLLDLIDELMAVSAKDRPANTDIILQQLNNIENNINHINQPKTKNIDIPEPYIPVTIPITVKPNNRNQYIELYQISIIWMFIIPIIWVVFIYVQKNTYGEKNNDFLYIILLLCPMILYFPVSNFVHNFILPSDNDYLTRGNKYLSQGKYQKAIDIYSKAIKVNPNFVEAYYNRGNIYLNADKYYKAIANYNQAINLNPSYTDAYNNRGFAYSSLKEYQKAITDYNQAIKLDPSYTNAYNNRGLAYYDLKEYQKAILDFNKAIRLDPRYYNAYYNRGLAYYDLQEYQHAINDFNTVITFNPNYISAYYHRGNTYLHLQEYNKSIVNYNQAINLDPSYADAYYNRGRVYKLLGNTQNALSDFRKAATLYQQQGNTEKYNKAMNQIKELGG